MKKICIFDCSDRIGLFENILTTKLFKNYVELDVFHLPSSEWPFKTKDLQEMFENISKSYHGVVITGSKSSCMDDTLSYISDLTKIIQIFIKNNFPLLGICFGAQVIALAHYGRESVSKMVEVNKEPEFGFKFIKILQKDELFENCPTTFKATVSHEDCFHKGINSLACTEHWNYHAFRVDSLKVWGVQFHPEILGNDAIDLFNGFKGRKVVHEFEGYPDEDVAFQIAKNFVNQL